MILDDVLRQRFPQGIRYSDAIQLHAALFCSADWLPECSMPLSRDNLNQVFAQLAQAEFITRYDAQLASSMRALLPDFFASGPENARVGSTFALDSMFQRWHQPDMPPVTTPGHWQLLLDAAYRLPAFYDRSRVLQLMGRPNNAE